MLVESDGFQCAYRNHQARCTFNLHEELVCVNETCAHLAILVVLKIDLALGLLRAFECGLDIIDRSEHHGDVFVAGELLADFQCIRKTECSHT